MYTMRCDGLGCVSLTSGYLLLNLSIFMGRKLVAPVLTARVEINKIETLVTLVLGNSTGCWITRSEGSSSSRLLKKRIK